MRKLFLVIAISLIPFLTFAQKTYQCYPTHWWTGMKWNKVQVMVHGNKIADDFPMIKMGPGGVKLAAGVNLVKINR
ncbi:MAG TPA: cyclomaltodextrinase N-terminal domain-containing protein, partial [Ferruginibacter sp.]|nr:cyclomaltodextrinase N-terminal domain-containing protein [Ferruginibacter sp.]